MNTKKSLVALIVLALVASLVGFTGCAQATGGSSSGTTSSPLNGTWYAGDTTTIYYEYVFTDTTFTSTITSGSDSYVSSGTYTYDTAAGTLTLNTTKALGYDTSDTSTVSYVISGSTLTLTSSTTNLTLTKK